MHISRSSDSGRYVYTIGRGCAKIDMIDLYMDPPQTVAEIIGLEARSVETSKYKGYDKIAIAKCTYVLMDGPTLEPKKLVHRGMTVNPRNITRSGVVIVSSHQHPGVHRQREGNRSGAAGQVRRPRRAPA